MTNEIVVKDVSIFNKTVVVQTNVIPYSFHFNDSILVKRMHNNELTTGCVSASKLKIDDIIVDINQEKMKPFN